MPVARIISSSFEDALRFADYLRPLFDTVEIAQPGRASDTAVDLEVNLELCSPEQAWQQVAELSRLADSEVFIAPGALFSEQQPGGGQLSAEVELASQPEPAASVPPQEFDNAGCEVDAAIAQASAAAVKAAGSNGSGTHKSHSEHVPEQELNWLGRTRESLRQWLAVRALLREIRQMQQRELAREQQRQRQMALRFERERREREAPPFVPLPSAAPPQESVPAPPLPAPEPALVEELLQRKAEEQQQAEQEEAVRRGRFVEEILRRRAQEQSVQAAAEAGALEPEAVPVEFQALPAESFAPSAESMPVIRFSRQGRDRLRPAMALAGVTSVLLMAVLMGYAHRRPASPVPLSVLQRSTTVEQRVPFGPAVLPAPALLPAAATSEAPAEALLADAPVPERHTFQTDFRRVRVDRHEVDYVADDVTVRHFNGQVRGKPVPHPAAAVPISASSRGVKQISDME